MKPLKLYSVLVAGGVLAGLLTGCAWSIGDSDGKAHTIAAQPTRGQQLIDLKRAKDQGAITESEYETQKQRVLDR
jgi:hypothetical protein